MKYWSFVLVTVFLAACAGTVPLPKYVDRNAEKDAEEDSVASNVLQDIDARLQLVERKLAVNSTRELDANPVVWACSINLPFGKGNFSEVSTNPTTAMYKVGDKCTQAGNTRMTCEFNINCLSQ